MGPYLPSAAFLGLTLFAGVETVTVAASSLFVKLEGGAAVNCYCPLRQEGGEGEAENLVPLEKGLLNEVSIGKTTVFLTPQPITQALSPERNCTLTFAGRSQIRAKGEAAGVETIVLTTANGSVEEYKIVVR